MKELEKLILLVRLMPKNIAHEHFYSDEDITIIKCYYHGHNVLCIKSRDIHFDICIKNKTITYLDISPKNKKILTRVDICKKIEGVCKIMKKEQFSIIIDKILLELI